VLLDHLTRGRVMLGTGPGSLPSDAYYLGLDYTKSRERCAQSLEVIMRLLRSDEPITMETDWFSLRDAQLQVRPYTYPHFEVTATSTVSPVGPKLAGQLGTSLITIAASTVAGTEVLRNTWETVEREAAEAGMSVSREGWRLVNFCHIAETEEQARQEVRHGLAKFVEYMLVIQKNFFSMISDPADIDKTIDELNASGCFVIGTPQMMIDQLKKLQDVTGGFGGFLAFGWEAADREATMRSHELIVGEVAPHFTHSTTRQLANWERLKAGGDWGSQVASAQEAAAKQYASARAESAI
jgi:limonene 1,2-monooxygenase